LQRGKNRQMAEWLALSSDGQMTKAEMLNELERDRICPVMTYMKDGKQTVPLFSSFDTALQFAKRNTPQCHSIGVMEMEADDRAKLAAEGFDFEPLEWPNKRDILIHVLFLDREVVTHANGYRRQIS
jgi:hypothetical protein